MSDSAQEERIYHLSCLSGSPCFPLLTGFMVSLWVGVALHILRVNPRAVGDISRWYAIKTKQDFKSEAVLEERCEEVFFPTEEVKSASGHKRTRAIIPHVVFMKTTRDNALHLEKESREEISSLFPFWIYRYMKGGDIQIITEEQIKLLKLLTAKDTTKCEIYNKTDFKSGQRVRVTGGFYKGYEGIVQRVKKNKHVIIEIKGICMVMLPFIHPDLLEVVG